MLVMGILIGIGSTYLEAKLVNSIPTLRRWYENGLGPIPGEWMNNAMSFLLGAVIGGSAGGTVALMGGLFGMVFSNIYFSMQKTAHNAGVTKDAIKEKSQVAGTWMKDNKVHFVNLGKTIMFIIKTITLPIRAIIKANSLAQDNKQKIQTKAQEIRAKVTSF